MHINKFLFLGAAIAVLAGCQGNITGRNDWGAQYGTIATGAPAVMQYRTFENTGDARKMAVLLPLSGDGAGAGRALRTSIETAVLQRGPENLSVSFFDTNPNATAAINSALGINPEIIVGPLFASDARTLRAMKPDEMPAISFTSDATAIGRGVMTMALMPTNGIETIVKEISTDHARSVVILAPDTNSGRTMAGAARASATAYDLPVSGVFYYREKDAESIKNAALRASMFNARSAAHTRAREILSDILTTQRITAIEKSSMSRQLDKLSKTETLGNLPYDAVLFLGTGDDTKSLASFLRYYGVGTRDAKFYGTAMWDGTDIVSDFTMSGAKYAALPETNAVFANIYEQIAGTFPTRIASFGYDAANLAMAMMYSNQPNDAYLLNPSGYIGIDGLFRLTPAGASQRALRIMEIRSGAAHQTKAVPETFLTPIYNIDPRTISPAREMELETPGINPLTYIQIPDRLAGKYKSKTYGANVNRPQTADIQKSVVAILPEDDGEHVITPSDFTPVKPESVNRTYIDSVEINE